MADEHYDAIVIGTSQGGRLLPAELAKAGHKVALVERGQLGGVCVNRGCTPTKTMVASARLAYQARRAVEFGVRTGPVSVDLAAVRERKQAMVAGARQNFASRLTPDGPELIEGEAHFTGPKTVEIDLSDGGTRQVSAPAIVIDAGTRPRPLELAGAGDVTVLDSTSIMELDEVPEHLIVLGGGYIGLEFGQMFRRFGSEVTIIEMGSRLVQREDTEISSAVQELLINEGITLRLNARCLRVSGDAGSIIAHVDCEQDAPSIEGSHLLLAVGRQPNTDDLGLDAAGVSRDDRGYIVVNDQLETNVPGIWALGDCNGRGAFTHTAYNDFEIVASNLLEGTSRRISDRISAYALFIDPPLARRPHRNGGTGSRAPDPGRETAHETRGKSDRKRRDERIDEDCR